MKLQRNIIANYIGHTYVIAIGLIVTPLYLKYLGSEPYALVGIFALVQAWMSLLDVGITPALGRQAAILRSQDGNPRVFWGLLKSFEAIFMVLAVVAVMVIFIASDWLARDWINVQNLQHITVVSCLQLMGFMVGIRWFSTLYRSGIIGLEDQVWLNIYNIIIVNFKFIGALIIIVNFSNNIIYFFIYQLFVGFVELIILMWRLYSLVVKPENSSYFNFDMPIVKSVIPYALGIAYTSALWVFATQSDKLIFSTILPLSEFGYFTFVAMAAGGIQLISAPISQALMPRMTYLYSNGDNQKFIMLYRDSSQITTLVSLSVASIMALYSEPFLYAWTGDRILALWGRDALFWFSMSNAIMTIGAYPYYIQDAMGKLKWHVVGTTLMTLLQVPSRNKLWSKRRKLGLVYFSSYMVSLMDTFFTSSVHTRNAHQMDTPRYFTCGSHGCHCKPNTACDD
jgi:O-antigen/teichoic acid export membrane protein